MHSSDLIHRFIELRAQGKSLMDISERISVPKSTLHDWEKRHAAEIQLSRAGKWEYVETGFGFGCEEDLGRLIQRLRRCEEELSRRSLSQMTNSELIRLTFATRREYFKRRDPLLKPLEHPRRNPNPTLNPNPDLSPTLNGDPKPEKTGQKPEINSNHRNGNHLHPHKNPDNFPDAAADSAALNARSESPHAVPSPGAADEVSVKRESHLGQGEGDLHRISLVQVASADAVHDTAHPNGRATCPHGAASPSAKPNSPSADAVQDSTNHTSRQQTSQNPCDLPKKHQPTGLNGHYYPNPEIPYHVARSLFAKTG
jgi:hypothetical protein